MKLFEPALNKTMDKIGEAAHDEGPTDSEGNLVAFKFWPNIENEAIARYLAKTAAWVMFTAAMFSAFYGVLKPPHYSLVDAMLFAICGWGFLKLNRPLSYLGAALYLLGTIATLKQGIFWSISMRFFFLLGILHGVRGVAAFHRFKSSATSSLVPPAQS